jgi:ribosomal protein S18 acetylase RimI-like enzyme
MQIVRAGGERIADLQPLWESLSRHHAEVAPELVDVLGEIREPRDSWEVRRALYEEWFDGPDTFALIAEDGSGPVGYAVVQVRGPEETWSTGDRVAELQTLAVLPGRRGQGIGTALVERMHEELRRMDVSRFFVAVIASNADSVRFYERLGLTRFMITYAGRVPAASAP